MKPTEAAALLTIAAAFDNRKPDADQAKAWAMALDGLRFEDCREVVVAHYRTSRDWLMPSDVVAGVKRLRRRRIDDYGPFPEPPAICAEDPAEYSRWYSDLVRRIADGEQVERPAAIEPASGSEHAAKVRELMAGAFQMIPADNEGTSDA